MRSHKKEKYLCMSRLFHLRELRGTGEEVIALRAQELKADSSVDV
jgi:hypothetical protein